MKKPLALPLPASSAVGVGFCVLTRWSRGCALALLLGCLSLAGAQSRNDRVRTIRDLPNGPVKLPKRAYFIDYESCADDLAEAVDRRAPTREVEEPKGIDIDCYLVTSDEALNEDALNDFIAELSNNFLAGDYELVTVLNTQRVTNQLWLNDAGDTSVDLSYWLRYDGGLLLSVGIRSPRRNR